MKPTAVIMADAKVLSAPKTPLCGLAEGLAALGYDVTRTNNGAQIDADLVCIWNGRKLRWRRNTITPGPKFYMEHGFFDRHNHIQMDPTGFNHWATWADSFDADPPADAAERLARVASPVPVRARTDGYILVLRQVLVDTLLAEAEDQACRELTTLVEDATPSDVPILVRPHPSYPRAWEGQRRRAKKIKGTLADALAGARFVVTINSNAGNDALVAGLPVLCFGPALYANAGVALTATPATLKSRINLMLRGYCPSAHVVRRYLEHLACRQYNYDDLADGQRIKAILEG